MRLVGCVDYDFLQLRGMIRFDVSMGANNFAVGASPVH